jgi:heavy metal sensor kinase
LNALRKRLSRYLDRIRFVRSLRFRLAASFLLFFTVLLTGIGLLFREIFISILYDQTEAALEEEWGASKGYLRFEHERPLWFYDRFDPEESLIVSRINRVECITDSAGNILERSDLYHSLGVDSLDHIKKVLRSPQGVVVVRKDDQGTPYMIRQGMVPDEHHHEYFVAIGRSMGDGMHTVRSFLWRYFAFMPLLIAVCAVLGWLLAGRALAPVNQLAATAHEITGSNLTVRIPLRNAGDELDDLIEAFNRMIERLKLSFEQMRQFSTDVSHELRTPLTAIRGQLEVALFTAQTPEQYQEAMVNALQDVEQLSNIVRALLLLSQAESGQLALQMGPIDLSRVAEEMVDQYQIPAEAAKVTLTSDIEPRCLVRADRTQMERLFSNLLSNAVKYTPEGGQVTVVVRNETGSAASPGGGSVRLTVDDTGIGIPAEKLPHIFDRFYRVRTSRTNQVQGLGLGLSFVSWIVQAHGGRIQVDSQEGRGSRFTVLLPAAATTTAAQRAAPVAASES